MAVSFGCKCVERRKPLKERRWVVVQRQCNHSAFSGYYWTPSEYSEVLCLNCDAIGRTKADYVFDLRDATDADLCIRQNPRDDHAK